MKQNYTAYKAIDFLKDEDFLQWQMSSPEESTQWEEWLKEYPEKKQELQEAIRLFRLVKMNSFQFTKEEKGSMLDSIRRKSIQRKKRLRWYYTSAAACIALLIAVSISLPRFSGNKESILATTGTTADKQEIQLILPDNKILNFEQDAAIFFNDRGEVSVKSTNQSIDKLKLEKKSTQWNKLIVPKGKRSSLTLADGSVVWVNAGTTLKFPATFSAQRREIAVDGEIYIQVKHDSGKPFQVQTEHFSVNVLGTRFDVSAYSGDMHQSVILEEGAVEVVPASTSSSTVRLRPNERLSVHQESYQVQTVDVYQHISWKDGLLQYNSELLPQVLTQLEKYYGVKLTYDSSVQDMRCTGKLVLFDDVEEVLKVIAKSIPIRIEKQENSIHINRLK